MATSDPPAPPTHDTWQPIKIHGFLFKIFFFKNLEKIFQITLANFTVWGVNKMVYCACTRCDFSIGIARPGRYAQLLIECIEILLVETVLHSCQNFVCAANFAVFVAPKLQVFVVCVLGTLSCENCYQINGQPR